MEERLQKLLSEAGVCSRRTAETLILAGRVTVDGETASLGDRADPDRSVVALDGKPIVFPEEKTYLMLYKPRGYVTTLSDERGRNSVDRLVHGCGARVWPVGRLDLDSEGLLLMTDDGALTQRLLHPSHQVEKEYLTWVLGDADGALPVLTAPMCLEGDRFSPATVRLLRREGEKTLLSMVIREGKNRQIRRMCAHAGLEVLRLKRIREDGLTLDRTLRPGQWRPLTPREKRLLRIENIASQTL